MPATTPTTPRTIAVSLFREMLSKCSSFHSFIGATGTTEQKVAAALLKIYAWDDDGEGVRPFAVVSDGGGFRGDRVGYGVTQHTGRLFILLEGAYDAAEGVSDAHVKFGNHIGGICNELLSKRDSDPTISSVALNGHQDYNDEAPFFWMNEDATEDDSGTPAVASIYALYIGQFDYGFGA